MAEPLTLFWTIWRERNIIAFENRELSAQRMKALFLCNYWSGTNMYLTNRSRSLVDFLTWWGVSEGWWVFLFSLFPFEGSLTCGPPLLVGLPWVFFGF